MVVFSNARAGREAEYNDWYSYVHVHDVMLRCPGARWVARYELARHQGEGAAPRYRYLALYAGDHAGFTAGHRAHIFSDAMPISTAFDVEDHRAAYYEVAAGDEAGSLLTGPLFVERYPAGVDPLAGFAAAREAPEVRAALVATAATEQLFPQHEDTAAVGLYVMTAPPQWKVGSGTERALYTPLWSPLTAARAREPHGDQREQAARVRASMDRMAPPRPRRDVSGSPGSGCRSGPAGG